MAEFLYSLIENFLIRTFKKMTEITTFSPLYN
jgi:hypothetical protein